MKTLLLTTLFLISLFSAFAQNKSSDAECKRIIKELIIFQKNLEKYKFDQNKVVHSSLGWGKYICLSEEPFPIAIEMVGESKSSAIQQPVKKTDSYVNANVLDINVFSNPGTGLWAMAPFENGISNRDKVESITEFIKREGKKIGDKDFVYAGLCFRMSGIMSLQTKGQFSVSNLNNYQSAFKLIFPWW